MARRPNMKRSRIPKEQRNQMDLAFYGALNIINKRRIAQGKEPHPVPDKFKPKRTRPILKIKTL